MIPIRDHNRAHRTPFVTFLLIGINVMAFLYQWGLSDFNLRLFLEQYAIVPQQLVSDFSAEWFTLFTAMFLHGGWSHLLGNMVYLWVFGDNLEDRLGTPRFLLFYLSCGIAATAAQVAIEPFSSLYNVGASGAIAGVLGGYLILYPFVRVITVIPIPWLLFPRIELPAIFVLGFWFVIQVFNGLMGLGAQVETTGGVAFFAHIGGFVAGLLLTYLFGRQPTESDSIHEL